MIMVHGNGKADLIKGENAWVMEGKTLSDVERERAVASFNKAFEDEKAQITKKYDEQMALGEKIKEERPNLEIMPLGTYVLVRPYSVNPYNQIKTDSGLVIPAFDGTFNNPDTGTIDQEDQFSRQGTVLEVGPLVKFVKEGDDVFYRCAQAVPIPFFQQGFEVVPENCIQCVVNEGIKDRWSKNKD